MIICPKCGKVISYNSYFKGYICNYCSFENRDNKKNATQKTFKVTPYKITSSNSNLMSVHK